MDAPLAARCRDGLFLEGPAGAGKTSRAVGYLQDLLTRGAPASSILVLLPQRGLSDPYWEAAEDHVGGTVQIVTISGLARRMILRFWPLVTAEAGFDENRPPTFLTLETAQYFMSRVAGPLMEEGAFAGLSILESRLYSQLIDNINKAALVGFPPSEIASRLKDAWIGDDEYEAVFDDVQRAADRYRALCREHNLLDFAFQLQVFTGHLWPGGACRRFLTDTYDHLIADNVEEGVPVTHDLLLDWVPALDTALIVFDQEGGYRQFLGADPESARRLASRCGSHIDLSSKNGDGRSQDGAVSIAALGEHVTASLHPQSQTSRNGHEQNGHEQNGSPSPQQIQAAREQLDVIYARTHPEMLGQVAARIRDVLDGSTPPEEVAVVAPFLPDTLRYALSNALAGRDVPFFLRRPSRPLSQEPAVKALLALLALSRPGWKVQLGIADVAEALSFSISELDPIRARLLAEAVYQTKDGRPSLRPFGSVHGKRQDRITYRLGRRYDTLRQWISDASEQEDGQPIDHVLNRLFGEVLSQEGYGFHDDFEAAALADSLVESARKFRQVIEDARLDDEMKVGRSYLEMVRSGVGAAQYVRSWQRGAEDAVLIAPAHTYLMQNRTARHQFWLDIGNTAWHSRIRQPLTHPHVLSRSWDRGDEWTDRDEHAAGISMLERLVTGLSRRCEGRIHLAVAGRGQNGEKEHGYLLKAFQHSFGRAART